MKLAECNVCDSFNIDSPFSLSLYPDPPPPRLSRFGQRLLHSRPPLRLSCHPLQLNRMPEKCPLTACHSKQVAGLQVGMPTVSTAPSISPSPPPQPPLCYSLSPPLFQCHFMRSLKMERKHFFLFFCCRKSNQILFYCGPVFRRHVSSLQ